MRRFLIFFTIILPLVAAGAAPAATQITNIRHWAAPEHTRIVIDTSDDSQFTVQKSPLKVSIIFKGAEVSEDIPNEKIINKPGLEKFIVRTDAPNENNITIELC